MKICMESIISYLICKFQLQRKADDTNEGVSGGYGPLPVWQKFGGFGPRIDYIVVCVNHERC